MRVRAGGFAGAAFVVDERTDALPRKKPLQRVRLDRRRVLGTMHEHDDGDPALARGHHEAALELNATAPEARVRRLESDAMAARASEIDFAGCAVAE